MSLSQERFDVIPKKKAMGNSTYSIIDKHIEDIMSSD